MAEYKGDYPKFEDLNDATCQERSIRIHYPEFHKYLTEHYKSYEKWGEKMALFYRNLEEPPKCLVCGKPCKFQSLRDIRCRTNALGNELLNLQKIRINF